MEIKYKEIYKLCLRFINKTFDILNFENLLRICLDNDSIQDIFNLSFNSMICFVIYLENYKINLEII